MSTSYLILNCFSMLVMLGVGVFGLVKYRQSVISIRLLVWYILIWLVVDIVEFIMSRYHIRNLWVAHCDNLIEVILFAAIVFHWRISNKTGSALIVSSFVFSILWIVGKFTFEPMTAGDDITYAVSRLIIIIFSVQLMFLMLKEQAAVDLKKDSRFWIATGFIIHSVGTLLLFSSFNYLVVHSKNVLIALYPLNWIFAIITHLFFAVGIWCRIPREKSGVEILHQSELSTDR